MGVFSFRSGPSYRAATPDEQMAAAIDMPMSLGATLLDQAKGGALDSYGLGTAIKDFTIPEGETTATDEAMSVLKMLNPMTSGYESTRRAAQYLLGDDSKTLTDGAYKASPYFREGIAWDQGMTEDRAAALAEAHDARRVREHFASKRPVASFFGGLGGQALDPINYIPLAGPAIRAANAARFGKVAGAAVTSSLDAAANTALFGIGTAPTRARYGDDVSWQALTTDIAMSALIGGAFGTIGGVLGKRRDARIEAAKQEANARLSTLKNVQDARIALNSAIDGLARGEDVNLSANAADAVQRLADNSNPVWSPQTFASIERNDLFSSTSVGRFIDNRPVLVQDAEVLMRNQVLANDPALAARYADAEAKFQQAQEAVAAIEEPLQARRQSDTLALFDPESAERLRSIEDDLAGQLKGNRRAQLEAERDLIVGAFDEAALAKAESDYRIGPTKQAKAARKALASARQQFSKVRSEADKAAERIRAESSIGRRAAVDLSPARPEEPPAGRVEAEARVSQPDTYKAMSEQYRVNPDDGSFLEQSDIDQLRNEGRLTADDELAITEADETYETGVSYGEALKAVVGCLI